MSNELNFEDKNFAAAFTVYDRRQRIQIGKIACFLSIILSLAGISLDYFIYPKKLPFFIALRLASSVLAGFLWYLHTTAFGQRYYRFLGVPIALNPIFFLGWVIETTPNAASSPYYAGWILIIMAASLIMRWSVRETLVTIGCVFAVYGLICFWKGLHEEPSAMFSNLFFLWATSVIATVGNHFAAKFRVQEFTLRYQLDKNKQELEETNRRLVELDRLKSRFFANISHELRTPLALLLSPLETLLQRFQGSLDGEAREHLLTMQANGMRLLKLINDLLELIRLEAGRLEIKNEPLEIADFVKGLGSAVRQVAVNKNITLETHVDPQLGTALADRDKLEKVVLNLLFNALKFTPANGKVWLRAEKQDENIVLTVRDTGMGIADKNLAFVFDRFWQADSSSKRKFQGVGIGLSLVKELTEMMGGSVTVQSEEGRGATFTVKLPFRKADPAPEPKRKVAEPTPASNGAPESEEWLANLYRRAELFPSLAGGTNVRQPEFVDRRPIVLIADDEPDMRRFLRAELQSEYNIVEVADGLQALQKIEEYPPNIVLLDLMMPEMDGLEVCRELRKRAVTAALPVILLTARADEETKFEALEMGANDFLAKPFSSSELHVRVKNLIESHDYQRRLSKQNEALTSAIDQIKETEMQLVQSEKLASLGRLSAGIIHEINNPLNFTMTGLFALRNQGKLLAPEQRGEFEAIVSDVEEGIKRVKNIVTDLRTFTHPGGGTGETVDVAEAVDASLRFLSGEWKNRIQIEKNLLPGQIVWANRSKVIQILVNLLQNSIDALSEKKFDEGHPTIWIDGRLENNRSQIIVRDNGSGIDPKLLDKIFDPFFTTKEVGKGMGLGLSICYRIMRAYSGEISVQSERGRFCEFTLNFLTQDQEESPTEIVHGKSLRL